MNTGFTPRDYGFFPKKNIQRNLIFGVILLIALVAFEVFNFSSTQVALSDLLGDLTFIGFRWATILTIAFCGIDFAGIARLFAPTQSTSGEPQEVWYLFGAWLLAATMNAVLTWWGVSIALVNHQTQSSAVIDPQLILTAVPIVVAIMVWLIRIMIIGTLSMSGERFFGLQEEPSQVVSMPAVNHPRENYRPSNPVPQHLPNASFGAASRPVTNPTQKAEKYVPSHRPNHRSQPPISASAANKPSPVQPATRSNQNPERPEPEYVSADYERSDPSYHSYSGSNGQRRRE